MKKVILFILCFSFILNLKAQEDSGTSDSKSLSDQSLKATNFSVPNSLAFDLLEVSPSNIHRPGITRDFKSDWIFNNNGLNPNIAFEAEPIWLLFHRKTSFMEFEDKRNKYLRKTLSSLNLSVGTVTKDSTQSLAYGLKINLFTEKHPMFDNDLILDITPKMTKIDTLLRDIEIDIDNAKTKIEFDSLSQIKDSIEVVKEKESASFNDFVINRLEVFEKENWNSTVIDLGFGQILNYDSEKLDSLNLTNKGFAFWLAGVTGIGKKVMLNGIIKYSVFDEFKRIEPGGNIRYGSLKVNGFVELLYQYTDFNEMENTKNIILAYGVDYKASNGFYIQASLKTKYDEDFKVRNLIPTISFNYQLSQ
ncbi:hypothetical protein R9C00_06820 [Flammeovirgaceae bacterium SG7u.111]|nr:hypothetical protein [Flammeovirgaceae bacterium SG7u.132]WPO37155.1 hypothetical protein R9C00_06820 [Flammeovirgaceae bacterium SG7u.111]